MNKTIKQTAKKIYKAGFFHSIHTGQNWISFKNTNNVVFSFQLFENDANLGRIRAGYVNEFEALQPTFESEYNQLGMVKRAVFYPFFAQNTDNPDFILRAAKLITLN